MTFTATCATHGLTEWAQSGRHKRCKKCAAEAVVRRRKKLKRMAIEYKGGKCEFCGYCKCERALDFHHRDPTQKEFGIGYKGETRSWERTRVELDKCILLCANCHREEHDRLESVPV